MIKRFNMLGGETVYTFNIKVLFLEFTKYHGYVWPKLTFVKFLKGAGKRFA